MYRGLGICTNAECAHWMKGAFLFNFNSEVFYCAACRQEGIFKLERRFWSGDSPMFRQVNVEYDYNPLNDKFQRKAVVVDESLPVVGCSEYTLQSPLIHTDERALKMAETVLGNLNFYGSKDPNTTEIILSFDDCKDDLFRKLHELHERWSGSGLCKRNSD